MITAVVAGLIVGFAVRAVTPADPRPVIRSVHVVPDSRAFRNDAWPFAVISPNGEYLVYNSNDGLVLRALDSLDERVIPGTEAATIVSPVFSPDGQSVAYLDFSSETLERISVTGGVPTTLFSSGASSTDLFSGMSWGTDGTILFTQLDGIWEIPENGGEPRRLIEIEAGAWADSPQRLPGGEWIQFTLARADGGAARWEVADLVAESLVSGDRRTLWSGGSDGRYLPTGHLVFAREDVLYAMPFDVDRLEPTASPTPVVQGILRGSNQQVSGFAAYSLTRQGTLVYVPGTFVPDAGVIAIADGNGGVEQLAIPSEGQDYPRVSPDGRQVAYESSYTDGTDVALYELGGDNAPRRLTFGGGSRYPVWSSNSEHVAFQANREDGRGLFWQLADGSGSVERLTTTGDGEAHVPDSFSPDGEWLTFTVTSAGQAEVWLLSLESGEAEPLIAETGALVRQSAFSPDGRWLAYQTTETGQDEIFVQPFPPTGARFQLPGSLDNHHPIWAPDGRTLYYVPGPGLFAAIDVRTEPSFAFGTPAPLNLNGVLRMGGPEAIRRVDILPDSGRFLGIRGNVDPADAVDAGPPQIVLVQNWFEELRRLVPTE